MIRLPTHKPLSIKAKFALIFSASTLLLLGASLYSLLLFNQLKTPLVHNIPQEIERIKATSHLDSLAQQTQLYDEILTQSARNYAFTGDIKWKDRYYTYDPLLGKVIDDAIASGDAEDKQFFDQVGAANKALVDLENEAIAAVDAKNRPKAVSILEGADYARYKNAYKQELDKYVARRGTKVSDGLQVTTTKLAGIADDTNHIVSGAIITLLVISLIGILLAGFAWLVSSHILSSISRLARGAFDISQTLAASAEQTTAASVDNASVSRQMADGAVGQSRQAEEISRAIAQMSAATQQISASSQEAAATAVKTSQIAQDAGEASERIGKAVDAITTVSEQTNLLALNAAIEAAHAGDAGRGFAVVADEVRKLAEGSGKSAAEIKNVVQGISTASKNAVTASQDTAAKIQQLSAGTQQQAAAVNQIAKNMDTIATVAQQNASGVQQLSASIEQQSSSNQQVVLAAKQLSGLSDELQALLNGSQNPTSPQDILPATTAPEEKPDDESAPTPHKIKVVNK